MSCCRKRTLFAPLARICPTYDSQLNLVRVEQCSDWRDRGCNTNDRQAEWLFYQNEEPIESFAFAALDSGIPIGQNSTYDRWNLQSGAVDIFDYFESRGFPFDQGEILRIELRVKNCNGKINTQPSNTLELVREHPVKSCANAWLTLSGEPFSTIDGACWTHL